MPPTVPRRPGAAQGGVAVAQLRAWARHALRRRAGRPGPQRPGPREGQERRQPGRATGGQERGRRAAGVGQRAAQLWAPPAPDRAAPEELLGARRARILLALDRPASTQELARRLGASAAGVSEHLSVLRRAGLVAGRRDGRHALYARTRAGETVLGAAQTALVSTH